MATDTPNFNWPIPEDTDLVKDGAKAIRDLGNAIDTSAQDFGGGLVHIETQTFSAVSAVNFDDVFSSTYDNYRIISNIETPSTAAANMRLRVSGTDNTSTQYRRQTLRSAQSLTSSALDALETSWVGGLGSADNESVGATLEVFSPFQTKLTSGFVVRGLRLTTASQEFNMSFFGISVTTSYTGFTALASTGTISGQISVYGYRKS
jgi:hypothetical protein